MADTIWKYVKYKEMGSSYTSFFDAMYGVKKQTRLCTRNHLPNFSKRAFIFTNVYRIGPAGFLRSRNSDAKWQTV